MSRSVIVIFMRDAVFAVVIIAVLVFLDRREERGGRSNPLRSRWRGKASDAGTAAWRAPWSGDRDAEHERRDDVESRRSR